MRNEKKKGECGQKKKLAVVINNKALQMNWEKINNDVTENKRNSHAQRAGVMIKQR